MQWHIASFPFWGCDLNHDAISLPMSSNMGVLGWQRRMGTLIPEGEPEQALDRLGLLLSGRSVFFPPWDTTSQKKTPQVRKPWYCGCDYLFSFPHFIKNSKSIHEHKFVVLKDSTHKNWRYTKKLYSMVPKAKATQVSRDVGMNELSDLYIMYSHLALKSKKSWPVQQHGWTLTLC